MTLLMNPIIHLRKNYTNSSSKEKSTGPLPTHAMRPALLGRHYYPDIKIKQKHCTAAYTTHTHKTTNQYIL